MTAPSRAYVVGLPVAIGLMPDGSVLVDVDLSEAGEAVAGQLTAIPLAEYDEATTLADSRMIGDACAGLRPLTVTSSAACVVAELLGQRDQVRHLRPL